MTSGSDAVDQPVRELLRPDETGTVVDDDRWSSD
jgi:hypothetical protein